MASVSIRSHGHEPVADPAHGEQALRVRRVALDLAAQVRDVDVAGALVAYVGAVPEVLHDLAAAEDALRLGGKEREQPELRRGQAHALAVDPHLVAGQVEAERADLLDRVAHGETVEVAPAEDRADA